MAKTATAIQAAAEDLETLYTRLKLATEAAAEAAQAKKDVEELILNHPEIQGKLLDEGTNTIGNFKIVTGFTRTWDIAALGELKTKIKEQYWPFNTEIKTEIKEIRVESRIIEKKFPDLWAEIAKALTIKEKKPVIKLIEKK